MLGRKWGENGEIMRDLKFVCTDCISFYADAKRLIPVLQEWIGTSKHARLTSTERSFETQLHLKNSTPLATEMNLCQASLKSKNAKYWVCIIS